MEYKGSCVRFSALSIQLLVSDLFALKPALYRWQTLTVCHGKVGKRQMKSFAASAYKFTVLTKIGDTTLAV